MNCDEARASILGGAASPDTEAHLEGCASCRVLVRSLEAGGTMLSDPSVWEEPPPELRERVVSMIDVRPTSTEPGRRRRPRWEWFAGAAALVIAAVAVAIVLRPTPPDWEVSMPGTELAPVATSVVAGWNTDAGTRLVLTIDGLPPAPAGAVYELWLSSADVHVSAGTFTASGDIELWTGVRRSDFPRLWVTIEPIDTDESPSGRTVLDTG